MDSEEPVGWGLPICGSLLQSANNSPQTARGKHRELHIRSGVMHANEENLAVFRCAESQPPSGTGLRFSREQQRSAALVLGGAAAEEIA